MRRCCQPKELTRVVWQWQRGRHAAVPAPVRARRRGLPPAQQLPLSPRLPLPVLTYAAGRFVTTVAPVLPAWKDPSVSQRNRLDLAELTTLVQDLAADNASWVPYVRFDPARRFCVRLPSVPEVDVWLLTWLDDQSTDLHDHGESAAAFTVVRGELREVRADGAGRVTWHVRRPGETTWVAPGVVHDVRHSDGPAVSIHAYSPRLTTMTYYRARRGRLRVVRTVDSSAPEFEGVR